MFGVALSEDVNKRECLFEKKRFNQDFANLRPAGHRSHQIPHSVNLDEPLLKVDEAPRVLHLAVVTKERWKHDVAAFGAVDEVEAVAEEVNAGCVTEVVDWG